MIPNPAHCLTWPDRDHTACPSSVECTATELRTCGECSGLIVQSVFGRRGGGARWVHVYASDWHPSKGGHLHQAVPA